jgi:hypothetical protein
MSQHVLFPKVLDRFWLNLIVLVHDEGYQVNNSASHKAQIGLHIR